MLKDFEDIEVVDTKFAIHIKNKNVNKGIALKKIAEIMGISMDEIAAIGDSENDKEMLAMAGFSISVAEESLKKYCDYVAKSGEEALNIVIKKILNNRK
ncbi:MAG: hypothetical protein DRN95_02925 [Candidatus Hydrothermarchaeota archaeon]|nr:MAG: hypothetical protein DRN95_02925 [Candidatus Hydrothermarchaeota archaeon]